MGRVAKKTATPVVKEIDDSPTQTITQSRTRRTPKPNPKYTNELIIPPPKIESESPDGSSDVETKEQEKETKSVKKTAEAAASGKGNKASAVKGKALGKAALKKQKLDYDEEEREDSEEDDKPAPRSTRSAKGEAKALLKIGDDEISIVDVSSIISKAPEKQAVEKEEPPKRGPGRKRTVVPDESFKEETKKKKEEEKPSLITARKSYMPSPGPVGKKAEAKMKESKAVTAVKEHAAEEKKDASKTVKTKRNLVESPQLSEPVDKKLKTEDPKHEVVKPEIKKLITKKKEPEMKIISPAGEVKTTGVLPTKNPNSKPPTIVASPPKPVPRILNSMITPKGGKHSPNVKLAGDGSDKKVFSIDLTDDTVKEKKIVTPQFKTLARPLIAVKENLANNKPQPAMVLKNKLESELIRMKASANMVKRQMIPVQQGRQSLPVVSANAGPRRITKFESWYVIDVKHQEPKSFRHTHTHSLISLGNNIEYIQMPSENWDYKVTLQRRPQRGENNNDEEVYTGDVNDKSIEDDKANYEPSSILFKRTLRQHTKVTIDRSLMLKPNAYTITMNGRQCKLIGAPDDIKSLEDLEILLSIIDSSNLQHSCVELVTNSDIITIS